MWKKYMRKIIIVVIVIILMTIFKYTLNNKNDTNTTTISNSNMESTKDTISHKFKHNEIIKTPNVMDYYNGYWRYLSITNE